MIPFIECSIKCCGPNYAVFLEWILEFEALSSPAPSFPCGKQKESEHSQHPTITIQRILGISEFYKMPIQLKSTNEWLIFT